MEAIVEAFGIDAHLIIVQIVNFAILMAALGYFLYTPILNMLRDREEKIAAGIRDAEAAAVAKASAEEEKKVVLTDAHKAAAEVGARAKATAETTAAEILAAAETAAAAAKAKAAVEAEGLKADAIKASEAEIAKTAILAAEKILREKSS
jgi:F-type H+-transporting ATPase subunit b